jgi:signal transduction histidine kinase
LTVKTFASVISGKLLMTAGTVWNGKRGRLQHKSIISRVITLIFLILIVGVGASALFFFQREHDSHIASSRAGAEILLSTLEKSIYNSMKVGNSADVQAILETVGGSEGVAQMRIFHPDGRILRSARPAEIGSRISSEEMSLFQGSPGEGVFRQNGEEFLVLIRPIISEESCFPCHGGDEIIGILNINLSLASTLRKLHETRLFFIGSTAVIIALLALAIYFVLLRFVRGPIQVMAAKMAHVEAGDLSVRLEPLECTDMGSLAKSFNSMVDTLEKTKKELEHLHLRQMERADRLASIGEMSTGIAHEIKNPLAGISGAISVLADAFPEGDTRREIVREVLEQITRLNKTATDLLRFGRPGAPEFTYSDINALVKKTLFFIDQHPEGRNIRRVVELARDIPLVWVDEKQIQQVLLNLIVNAIQSMRGEGALTIRTELCNGDGGAFIRLSVQDTGAGIPPGELDRIFVPFHTTKTQGTGLGLPISRRLLEQHGGTIRVESLYGKGATFLVELPLAQELLTEKEENCGQA